jgi:RNA polymerase-interacting CarD/CdnL/TRCF family regulator
MDRDYRVRQRKIREVKAQGTLRSICRLVRDLYGRRRSKHLNDKEEKTLGFYEEVLLKEWSLSAEVSLDDARESLQEMLEESLSEATAGD